MAEKFTLRQIYADLPLELSEVLIEAGITNLLNCIQIQKRLVLTCHYLSKQLGDVIDEGGQISEKENDLFLPNFAKDQNIDSKNGLISFMREYLEKGYLNPSTLNYEKSQEIPMQLINSVETKYGSKNPNFKQIFSFLKNGPVNYTSKASYIASDLVHDNDLHFREFYNLKSFDQIDEAEEIATHIMSELSLQQNKPIVQSLVYEDGRRFKGVYFNGARNGLGTQIL